jgi:hypothetical protein
VNGRAGTPTLISSYDGGIGLAVDAHSVYSSGFSGIQAIPRSGSGSAIQLTTSLYSGGQSLPGLASDGTYVYFGDANGLERIPVGGGAVEPVCASPSCDVAELGSVGAVVVDSTNVYWTLQTNIPFSDMVLQTTL